MLSWVRVPRLPCCEPLLGQHVNVSATFQPIYHRSDTLCPARPIRGHQRGRDCRGDKVGFGEEVNPLTVPCFAGRDRAQPARMTSSQESNKNALKQPTPYLRAYGSTAVATSASTNKQHYQHAEGGFSTTGYGSELLQNEGRRSTLRKVGGAVGTLLCVGVAVSLGRSWWATHSSEGRVWDARGAMIEVSPMMLTTVVTCGVTADGTCSRVFSQRAKFTRGLLTLRESVTGIHAIIRLPVVPVA